MTIAITGANGFVGRNLVAALLADTPAPEIRALVRDQGRARTELGASAASVDLRTVDVTRADSVRGAFDGVDIVVHTVAIPTERFGRFAEVNVAGTRHVVEEAKRAGVRKLVHLSAIGSSPASPYPYLRSKGEGQAIVEASGIPSVIVRSSLMFGEGDDFFPRLAVSLAFPVVPVPGDGHARFQPLHVADMAQALRAAIRQDIGGVHEVGGPDVITYDEMLAEAMRGLGVKRITIHVPVTVMKLPAFGMGLVLRDPPVTVEQLDLLAVDNTPRDNAIERVFGVTPRTMRGALGYLRKRA